MGWDGQQRQSLPVLCPGETGKIKSHGMVKTSIPKAPSRLCRTLLETENLCISFFQEALVLRIRLHNWCTMMEHIAVLQAYVLKYLYHIYSYIGYIYVYIYIHICTYMYVLLRWGNVGQPKVDMLENIVSSHNSNIFRNFQFIPTSAVLILLQLFTAMNC